MEQTKKEMLAQKLVEAANENNDFCKAFVTAKDAESLKKTLSDNGYDFSIEEIEELFADGLKEVLKVNSSAPADELNEEALEDVAGGGFLRGSLRLAASGATMFAYGVFCGLCPVAAGGAYAIAGGLTVWTTAGYMQKGW